MATHLTQGNQGNNPCEVVWMSGNPNMNTSEVFPPKIHNPGLSTKIHETNPT